MSKTKAADITCFEVLQSDVGFTLVPYDKDGWEYTLGRFSEVTAWSTRDAALEAAKTIFPQAHVCKEGKPTP